MPVRLLTGPTRRAASQPLPGSSPHRGARSAVLRLQSILGNWRVTNLIRADRITPQGGLARRQRAHASIQRKDTCSNSSSPEAQFAGQNEGKVFKSGDD